jgi:hypothetical protein
MLKMILKIVDLAQEACYSLEASMYDSGETEHKKFFKRLEAMAEAGKPFLAASQHRTMQPMKPSKPRNKKAGSASVGNGTAGDSGAEVPCIVLNST